MTPHTFRKKKKKPAEERNKDIIRKRDDLWGVLRRTVTLGNTTDEIAKKNLKQLANKYQNNMVFSL